MEFQDNKTEFNKELGRLYGEKDRLLGSLSDNKKSISLMMAKQNKLEKKVTEKLSDEEFSTAIKLALQHNMPATKAYNKVGEIFNKSESWSEAVINFDLIKAQLKRVVKLLDKEGNSELKLLKKHKLFDQKHLESLEKMRSVVVSLKKAFNFALTLKKKDQLITELDSNLKDKQKEIESLKQDLKKSLSLSVEDRVLALSKSKPSLSYVKLGKCLGISRQKVSRVINADSREE